jgi:dTDP-4-dehydrorhamnose reductase
MNGPRRVLVLGASGYVGGAIWAWLSRRHAVVGTCSTRAIQGLVPLDLRDQQALAGAVSGFDVVVHAAGLVDLGTVEADPELAWLLNVRSVSELLSAIGPAAKLVYLSSDNVFDGTREQYTEEDDPSPINAYGRTKVAAEELILGSDRHLAVRIPIMFGPSPFSDRFLARFAGVTTPAYTDVVCAPVYLPSFAAHLEQLWDLEGVVHYGGADIVTRFELLSRFRSSMGLATEVVPVRDADVTTGYSRPRRLVLRSVRHDLLGPGLGAALSHLAGPPGAPPP